MKSRHPLTLDLNNLFFPAITDGPKELAPFQKFFKPIHQGIKALKQVGNLPFSKIPFDEVALQHIREAIKKCRGFDYVVVFGIGGSALGALSFYHALSSSAVPPTKPSAPELMVIDHIDAQVATEQLEKIKSHKNLYVFISKAGTTAEIIAHYLHLKKMQIKLNKNNCFIITGPREGFLGQLAKKEGFPSLGIPAGVGGRFSVFTPVGLFPLGVCGIDVNEILDGACHAETLCQQDVLAQNPAGLIAMGLWHWIVRKKVPQVVVMPYSGKLKYFSDWFAQLWAESLGKKSTLDGKPNRIGTTPLKSLGVTDQHSQLQLYLDGPRDKTVMFVEVEETPVAGQMEDKILGDERADFLCGKSLHALMTAEKIATEESLRENNRPNFTVKIPVINAFQMGQLYQTFMNVIPCMGSLLNINAFDQPAVERIKKFTMGLMGKKGYEDFAEKVRDRKKRTDLVF